ncbi:MAG TPA: coniferyl aldehyde dehydrogenase [Casimicrobiaceae bacterium]|jgi:coniferyl-aldehyde dehydrogenase
MSIAFARSVVTTEVQELDRLFALQRGAFVGEPFPSLAVRRDRLRRLRNLVTVHERALCEAVNRDFGHRSAHETRLAELYIVAAETRYAMRHLRRWMRPRRVTTPLKLLPGTARVLAQPLGVVGIISPWNYPVQLALAPAVGALAAGNRVLLKPSEITAETSALLKNLISAEFDDDEFAIVLGDADVGKAFAHVRFDHLFFTGSTAVGRAVARAAAENLTPVTLELGGKSPVLIDRDADLALVAPRLVAGKLLNAGQTCIAPDYALVPSDRIDAFVAAIGDAARRLYPTFADNPDYTSIVNERHLHRLVALLDDAREKGARIVALGEGDVGSRTLAPTLVIGATEQMTIMREEIFGPLFPVETYDGLDEAIALINARPHPLAFYYFGSDRARRERVLRETLAGGVTVNDTLWHFAHEGLPFGGVGGSGFGAYHGERSFRTFSHEKSVFVQPRIAAARLLYPPYGKTFERVLALLKRLD